MRSYTAKVLCLIVLLLFIDMKWHGSDVVDLVSKDDHLGSQLLYVIANPL